MSDETPLECLSRLGTNGVLWAQEFNKTAVRLGYSEMDEEWLAGWFANAIENCDVIRCNPLRAENEQLRDSYDTEALLISYNLGYACGKDITKDIVKDEIERRHAEFTKVDMELVADLAEERNRLRERLAEADEANRRVSDENNRLRQALYGEMDE